MFRKFRGVFLGYKHIDSLLEVDDTMLEDSIKECIKEVVQTTAWSEIVTSLFSLSSINSEAISRANRGQATEEDAVGELCRIDFEERQRRIL